MIHKDYDAVFDGELSVDYNCKQGTANCILDYAWTCSGIKFCNNFKSTKSKFNITKEELQKVVGVFMIILR